MIRRNTFFIVFSALLVFSIPTLQSPTDDKNLINGYILSMSFDPDQVLAYNGSDLIDGASKEGFFDGDNFIVITREKKNFSSRNSDIGVISANVPRTYPGSLLLANSRLLDNEPTIVTTGRASLKYTVDLPGLTGEDGSFVIEPSYADYKSSLNKALNTWFEKYSKNHNVPALYTSESSFVKSKEQMRVKMGLDFKATRVESSIDFEGAMNGSKSILITKFKQVYYTVSVPPPRYPADLFDETVTIDEVKQRIKADTPPVLIDSVAYGRLIFVKIETTSTSAEAKAKLEATFAGSQALNSSVDYSDELENLSIKVYVMGGASEHVDLIKANNQNDINNVLVKYGKFGMDNQGFPISYSTVFINGNSERAKVHGYAEYTETTRTLHRKGQLVLEHKGR